MKRTKRNNPISIPCVYKKTSLILIIEVRNTKIGNKDLIAVHMKLQSVLFELENIKKEPILVLFLAKITKLKNKHSLFFVLIVSMMQ